MAATERPADFPDFALSPAPADISKPPLGRENTGWFGLEKPPHDWFNWLHQHYALWMRYADERNFGRFQPHQLLSRGAAVANGGSTGVVIDECYIIIASTGEVFATEDGFDTGDLGGDATYYIKIDPSDGSITSTTTESAAYGEIPIYEVVKSGGSVTSITAIGLEIGGTQVPTTLTVGGTFGMFPTLEDALVFAKNRPATIKGIDIVILQDTTVTATIDSSLLSAGLRIKGASAENGTGLGNAPELRWNFDGPLFHFDAPFLEGGFLLENLTFAKTAGGGPSSSDALIEVSAISVCGITLRGCTALDGAGNRLVGVVRVSGTGVLQGLRVEGGNYHVTDYFYTMASGANLADVIFDGPTIHQVGTAVDSVTEAFDFQVASSSQVVGVRLEGVRVIGGFTDSIIGGGEGIMVTGCSLAMGILLQIPSTKWVISGNAILGDGSSSNAVRLAGTKCVVSNNIIDGTTGILVDTSSEDHAIMGNVITATTGINTDAQRGVMSGNVIDSTTPFDLNSTAGSVRRILGNQFVSGTTIAQNPATDEFGGSSTIAPGTNG